MIRILIDTDQIISPILSINIVIVFLGRKYFIDDSKLGHFTVIPKRVWNVFIEMLHRIYVNNFIMIQNLFI